MCSHKVVGVDGPTGADPAQNITEFCRRPLKLEILNFNIIEPAEISSPSTSVYVYIYTYFIVNWLSDLTQDSNNCAVIEKLESYGVE